MSVTNSKGNKSDFCSHYVSYSREGSVNCWKGSWIMIKHPNVWSSILSGGEKKLYYTETVNSNTSTNVASTINVKTCNNKWFCYLSHLFQWKHRSWHQKPTSALRIQHPEHIIVLPHCSADPAKTRIRAYTNNLLEIRNLEEKVIEYIYKWLVRA